MKTVFILGAGASRYAGAPLMNDFFDRAEEINRDRKIETGSPIKSFETVFDAIYDLKSIHSKSYLDLDNLEDVFNAIELGLIIGGIKGRNKKEMKNWRDSLIDLIVKTLEKTIKFPLENGKSSPPNAHKKLFSPIRKIIRDKNLEPNSFSFLTFNYDIILDYTLYFYKIPFNYYFDESDSPKEIPLLKLHGSLNWGECRECKKIRGVPLKESEFLGYEDDPNRFKRLPIGSNISKKECSCGIELNDFPVIVPPTWDKTSFQNKISNVWKKAALVLKEAENIFIIGYSLPETDMFFKYLFALGTIGKTRIKKIVVVNPDPLVVDRYRKFLSGALIKRLKFHTDSAGYFNFSPRDRDGVDNIRLELEDSYRIKI